MDSTTVSVSEAQRFLISSNMFKVKLCVSYQIYGCFIRPEFMSLLLALTLVVIVLYYSSLIILKYQINFNMYACCFHLQSPQLTVGMQIGHPGPSARSLVVRESAQEQGIVPIPNQNGEGKVALCQANHKRASSVTILQPVQVLVRKLFRSEITMLLLNPSEKEKVYVSDICIHMNFHTMVSPLCKQSFSISRYQFIVDPSDLVKQS